MSSYIESIQFLIATLKELERERHYLGLKRYVHNLKRKRYLNGKEKFILKGATYYLKRLQLDRRAKSLGLMEYIPYNERRAQRTSWENLGDYRSWDRTVQSFYTRY